MKKDAVHYQRAADAAEALRFVPACRPERWGEFRVTADRRKVTCENCIRTRLYKGVGKK